MSKMHYMVISQPNVKIVSGNITQNSCRFVSEQFSVWDQLGYIVVVIVLVQILYVECDSFIGFIVVDIDPTFGLLDKRGL